MHKLIFEANDTLFFKEARPMETVGAKPLAGHFPPPARTMAGALRGIVGAALGVDWAAYRDGESSQQAVINVIGDAKLPGMGGLSMTGPYPLLHNERLYPAPLSLLKTNDGGHVRLRPGTALRCDLGKVYLPELEQAAPGARPLENAWLTRADLQAVLSGGFPEAPIAAERLFAAEPRLGIALDQGLRSAEQGRLYQTVHARLCEGVAIGIDVSGVPDEVTRRLTFARLGGEGRFAGVRRQAQEAAALEVKRPTAAKGIMLTLLTPARFDEGGWLPPGFTETVDAHGAKVWRCANLHGVALTIHTAVIGKALREGGWDLARHQSRPAETLIPVGSVFFCTVEGDLEPAVQNLQGKHLGGDSELGRGEIAVGYW